MKPNEFRCCVCGEVFEKGWFDEEAKAEHNELHPGLALEECDLACEDCFIGMQNKGSVPSSGEEPWFWMSFCDTTRPKGTQFLGACLVQGRNLREALDKTWDFKINPGGEVAFIEISKENLKNLPPWDMRYRLLSREEAESL